MSRTNPIVERIRSHRAWLEDQIAATQTRLEALKTEAASFDRLMAPAAEAPKPARQPRASRPVRVREHQRTVGAPEPGASLPLDQAAD